MSEALRANPGPEAIAWHAVPADQVVSRLKTDPAAGLDANEHLSGSRNTVSTGCRRGSSGGR